MRSVSWRRIGWRGVPLLALALLGVGAASLAHHVYFDRRGLPDLEPFIRFDLPTVGTIYDARGTVLVEAAAPSRTHAADFFAHSGVEYRALPRVLYKMAANSLAGWWRCEGFRLRFAQGGSTLTQQMVRGYFLRTDKSSNSLIAKMLPFTNSNPLDLQPVQLIYQQGGYL